MKIYSILLFLIILTTSCVKQEDNEYIALVGETLLKDKDIRYIIEVQSVLSGVTLSSPDALVLLINSAIEAEVAGLVGLTATDKEINEWITNTTSTDKTDVNEKIEDVFSDDINSYKQLYVKHRILNNKLRAFFVNIKDFKSIEIKKIKEAKKLVDEGVSFKQSAKLSKTSYRKYEINSKLDSGMEISEELQGYIANEKKKTSDESIIKIIKTMNTGSVYPKIIEDNSRYTILRYINSSNDSFFIESIEEKKMTIEKWFKEEGKKIKIKIVRSDLEDILRKNFEDLWWLENLN